MGPSELHLLKMRSIFRKILNDRRDNGYMGPPLSPFVSSLHCKPISSNTFLPYLLHLSRFINFLVFPSTWDAPFLHSLCFTLLLKQNSFFFGSPQHTYNSIWWRRTTSVAVCCCTSFVVVSFCQLLFSPTTSMVSKVTFFSFFYVFSFWTFLSVYEHFDCYLVTRTM